MRYLGLIHCLVGCFSMTVWTPAVLGVLCAYVLYFCICTCSGQLSMFHKEMRPRNTLIIINIIIKTEKQGRRVVQRLARLLS